jgi:hypothetical protein
VENKLTADVKRVTGILNGQEPEYDYGVDVSAGAIESQGYFNTGRSFIKSILCLYAYQAPQSFRDGGKVHIANDWLKRANSKNYHHFFPKDYLKKKHVDHRRINHVANITIVDDYLNKREIRTKPPSVYMKKFGKENKDLPETMKSHLIDLDGFGIWDDDYDLFFRERCKAISKRLRAWIPSRPIDALGGIVDDDLDPDDVADEDETVD